LGLEERARWKVVVEAPSWPCWSNTCVRGYCICFLSHYFNPLWNGILIQSLLSTMILTYFNHFEFHKSFVKWNSHSKSIIDNDSHLLQPLWIPEFWNVHNKHVIWNLIMDNHMINSGEKTAHKHSSLIISSMELRNSRDHPRSSSHWN
jgi:hypothetical protein